MTRNSAERSYALAVIVLPPTLVLFFAFLGVGLRHPLYSLSAGVAMYAFSGLGITLGYHRLFAHGSYDASRWLRYALAFAGTTACQGYFFTWIADHRSHHRCSDRMGDPHSPRSSAVDEHHSTLRGLYHAHLGWMLGRRRTASSETLVRDLHRDKVLAWIDRLSVPIALTGLAFPSLIALAVSSSIAVAAETLVWSGLIRVFVLNHVTWAVNSLGHSFGRQDFASGDQSRNNSLLGWLAFGEGWHNGHHAFPRSARHGLLPGQFDMSYALIRALAFAGAARNVRVPSYDAIKARQLGPRELD